MLVAAVLVAAVAAPARGQDGLERVAAALRDDPVYVDPGAELAGQVDAGALRTRIGSEPIFVAVLPASAVAGSPGRTLVALRDAVGVRGTYALAVGREFRTGSDSFDAAAPGDAAFAAHPGDLQAALADFVGTARRERARPRSNAGGVLASILAVAALLALAGGGVALIASRRRDRRERDARAGTVRERADEDFVRLGDGLRALELDVTLAPSGEQAKADYDRAVVAYERANALDRRGDPAAANRALDEGLQAIAAARERLAGRRPTR